jgi:HSP20 family protein
MYLKRIKPFGDEIMDRSISDFIGRDFTLNQPAVNIVEKEDMFELTLAAPGLEKENFSIKVEKDHLIVASEVKSSEEISEGKFTRKEFNYESFKRSFLLPKTVNKDEISAEYINGILRVSLNKKEEAKVKEVIDISIK